MHLLRPPGTGKGHLATALGVAAVKAGNSVYFGTLADIVASLAKAEREGQLKERIRFIARNALPMSTRSATCRSPPAAPTYSSSSSTPATSTARSLAPLCPSRADRRFQLSPARARSPRARKPQGQVCRPARQRTAARRRGRPRKEPQPQQPTPMKMAGACGLLLRHKWGKFRRH